MNRTVDIIKVWRESYSRATLAPVVTGARKADSCRTYRCRSSRSERQALKSKNLEHEIHENRWVFSDGSTSFSTTDNSFSSDWYSSFDTSSTDYTNTFTSTDDETATFEYVHGLNERPSKRYENVEKPLVPRVAPLSNPPSAEVILPSKNQMNQKIHEYSFSLDPNYKGQLDHSIKELEDEIVRLGITNMNIHVMVQAQKDAFSGEYTDYMITICTDGKIIDARFNKYIQTATRKCIGQNRTPAVLHGNWDVYSSCLINSNGKFDLKSYAYIELPENTRKHLNEWLVPYGLNPYLGPSPPTTHHIMEKP